MRCRTPRPYTMAYLVGLVVLLSVAVAKASVGNSSESSFCTETKECLLFDVVCKTSAFEDSGQRVTSLWPPGPSLQLSQVGVNRRDVRLPGRGTSYRLKLYQYINGANEDGVVIDMTAPVAMKVKDEYLQESSVFTIYFLLPSAFQKSAPAPTDSTVYFTNMPDVKVYVRNYSGFMVTIADAINAKLLANDLNKVNASYVKEVHYALEYDSPMKILNRHNDVVYVVKGDPVCSDPEGTQNGTR